jgi:myosin-5
VWLPDRAEVWIPGQIVLATAQEDDLMLTILPEGGAVGGREKAPLELCVRCNDDLPPLMNPDLLVGANDLTTLSYLHEPAGMDVVFLAMPLPKGVVPASPVGVIVGA